MSVGMRLVEFWLRRQPKALRSPEAIQESLAKTPPREAPVPRSLRRRCEVKESVVDGFPMTTLTPRRGGTDCRLIYLHGGAYVNGIVAAHWWLIGAIIKKTGATVIVPSYGLAPRYTAADAYPFLERVYADAVADGAPVYVAGDSAGGALALGMAIYVRDKPLSPPAALFLFSPWLDASISNPDAKALVKKDAMLDIPGLAWCGRQWAGNQNVHDPLVSPIFDTLKDLPPTFIYQGGHDILLADVKKFAAKAKAAGLPLTVRVEPKGFHVYMGVVFTPESRKVVREVASVMARKCRPA
ncbi:alpha/beta hydrolase fold domain-containing protein [Streptomyces seoulensis]|uniref:alpha/beta hydrolase fold domain-containing protein n=1 Tax=Streptomyces seoulensis TaxID=73044 RepID=UPI00364624B8